MRIFSFLSVMCLQNVQTLIYFISLSTLMFMYMYKFTVKKYNYFEKKINRFKFIKSILNMSNASNIYI